MENNLDGTVHNIDLGWTPARKQTAFGVYDIQEPPDGHLPQQEKQFQNEEIPSKTRRSCCSPRQVLLWTPVALVALGLIVLLIYSYLHRQPEYSEERKASYQCTFWEQIQMTFFDISVPALAGYKTAGKGAVGIVTTSRIIAPKSSLHTSSQLAENDWKPYGYCTLFEPSAGITVHFLNPQNRIYFIEKQKMINSYSSPQASSSRLLEEGQPIDYYAQALAKQIARLEGVEENRIIVREEVFWVGREIGDNIYKMETATQGSLIQGGPQAGNLTEEQIRKIAYAAVEKVVSPILLEKLGLIEDYGISIAKHFGFDFSRTTDLYIKFERSTVLASSGSQQPASSDPEIGNNTNQTWIVPKPPVVITTATQPIYGNRPAKLKQGMTISNSTYTSVTSCIDYNEVTKACTADEWQRTESPYKLSEESRGNEANFASFKWYRISVKPLPQDQVHQEIVDEYNIEEAQAFSLQAANSNLPPNLSGGSN